MATSKEEIKHGTAQARLTEDDMVRTGYVNGTPLEGGKIADSDPVDLFAGARHVGDASSQQQKQLPLGDEKEEGKKGGSEEPRVQARQGMGGGGRLLGRQ
ncbi:SEED MATURATION PROTEIN 1 [Lolium rigidum]|uniref:SEED MATURATION PROTEIN 1 n=1 Tax=Lolium rigidum TaxID=89674 RepID=UPI001F5CED5F|nr:SEED MATURATION PROTEIN 1 [Lolium rigidum]